MLDKAYNFMTDLNALCTKYGDVRDEEGIRTVWLNGEAYIDFTVPRFKTPETEADGGQDLSKQLPQDEFVQYYNAMTSGEGDITVSNSVSLRNAILLTNNLLADCMDGIPVSDQDKFFGHIGPLHNQATWEDVATRAKKLADACVMP